MAQQKKGSVYRALVDSKKIVENMIRAKPHNRRHLGDHYHRESYFVVEFVVLLNLGAYGGRGGKKEFMQWNSDTPSPSVISMFSIMCVCHYSMRFSAVGSFCTCVFSLVRR